MRVILALKLFERVEKLDIQCVVDGGSNKTFLKKAREFQNIKLARELSPRLFVFSMMKVKRKIKRMIARLK